MNRDRTKPSIQRNLLRLTLPALIAVLSACGGGGGGGGGGSSSPADQYEQDDSAGAARNISVNSSQNHNHYDDPNDWVKFNATVGNQYTLTTSNLATDADTTLELFDAAGNSIDYNDDYTVGLASQITWTPSSNGTYYVNVGSFGGYYESVNGYTTSTTGYTLTLAGQALPPTPDLTTSSMSVPTSVAINQAVTFSDSVINQGTAAAGSFYVDYYISTNSTISTGDIYLGSRQISSLAAGATSTASSSFAVPGTLSVGTTYYIGAIVDANYSVTELSETNNTSSGHAILIDPAAPADLTISGLGATANVPAGTAVTVVDTVSNSGATANGVDVYYYLSTDATITTSDTYIGSRQISSIDTTDDVNSGLDILISRNFTPGSYYLGAIVDPLNTVLENNDNDNTSNAVAVTIAPPLPSDLAFSSFVPDTIVNTYNQISITDTVTNQGSGDEASFDVSYYLSTDSFVDSLDTLLGTRTISSLAASASDTGTVNFSINRAVGTYYVYAKIDTAGQASESDTSNNTSLVATISVVNPDVSMTSFAASPTAVIIGGSMTITSSVMNVGTADITDSFYVKYYISSDVTVTTADTYVGSRTVNGLAANATSTVSATVTVPSNLANGTYYIAAIADPTNVLDDINTSNDTSSNVALSVSGNCTADSYEEDDSSSAARAFGVGTTQSHNYCDDATDWLSFTAVAGTSYTISTAIPTTASTDTMLYLYASDGTSQLASNDDSNGTLASLISWTAPQSGTYYIKSYRYAGSYGNFQDYTVTLSTP